MACPTGQTEAVEEFRKTNHSRCIDYELHTGQMFYVTKAHERIEVRTHARIFMHMHMHIMDMILTQVTLKLTSEPAALVTELVGPLVAS